MEKLDIDAIEARAKAATPGPWEVSGGGDLVVGSGILLVELMGENFANDAAFVAASRADVPALVAEVKRLRAEAESIAVREREAIAAALRLCQHPADHHQKALADWIERGGHHAPAVPPLQIVQPCDHPDAHVCRRCSPQWTMFSVTRG